MTRSAVSARIRAAVRRYGSQRMMARTMGISEQYLSDMIRGAREWSPDLLAHVGVERYTAYRALAARKEMMG